MKKESKQQTIKQAYKAKYAAKFKEISNKVDKLYHEKSKLEDKAIHDLIKHGMYLKDADSNDYYKIVKEDKLLKAIVLTPMHSIRVNAIEWELDLSTLTSITKKAYDDRLATILEYIVYTLK